MNHDPVHFGILLSNKVNKAAFVDRILSGKSDGVLSVFNNCKGILFSDLTIAHFIEKEHRHQSIEVSKSENRQLQTFSSGERRKVLLDYCLAQNPEYIIFDSPFDHLDQQSRDELSIQISALSTDIAIIQLSNREDRFLPFISRIGYVSDNSFIISDRPDRVHSVQKYVTTAVPSSLVAFERVYKTIIKFDKVGIDYDGRPIVLDIDWEIKQGEFWQLIGPNGSGKSTLLSLITGDNPKAYSQNITIFDRKKGSGESIWDIKKRIGHFSTNFAELFKKNQTVEQMVLSGFFDSVGLYLEPSGLQHKKAMQWLETVQMSHLKAVYFNKLTIGQQRLVLIIRALIKQPPLLILDEPFEGLDQENVNLVAQLLNSLIENTEITILYVSHTIESLLVPSNIYELIPTKYGSIGRIKA